MRARVKGLYLDNIAAAVVEEYQDRAILAKLGFTSPLGELEADKAAKFLLIDSEIEKVRKEIRDKKPRKG